MPWKYERELKIFLVITWPAHYYMGKTHFQRAGHSRKQKYCGNSAQRRYKICEPNLQKEKQQHSTTSNSG
jgi:hypothetical protein